MKTFNFFLKNTARVSVLLSVAVLLLSPTVFAESASGVAKEVGIIEDGTFKVVSTLRDDSNYHQFDVGDDAYIRFTISGSAGVLEVSTPPPVDVALVMDRSGSMDGTTSGGVKKITAAKNAMRRFVNLADVSNDRLGLASYSSNYRIDQGLTDNFSTVESVIDGLSAGGSTSIGGGLWRGLTILYGNTRQSGGEDVPQFIVLATDGKHNTSPDVTSSCPVFGCSEGASSILNLAVEMDVPVYTVGFGQGVREGYLQNIAQTTGGKYFPADSADQLEEVYGQISEDIRQRHGSFNDYLSTDVFSNPSIHEISNHGTTVDITAADLELSADNLRLSGDLRDKLGEDGIVKIIVKATVTSPGSSGAPPWQVNADDETQAAENKVVYALEDGSHSEAVSFNNPQLQVCQNPGPATNFSATDGLCAAPGAQETIKFSWDGNALATQYLLEISPNSSFPDTDTQSQLLDATAVCSGTACTQSINLLSGRWYWRVGSKNACVSQDEIVFSGAQTLDVFECAPINGTVYKDGPDANYSCQPGEELGGQTLTLEDLTLTTDAVGNFSSPNDKTFYTENSVNDNLPVGIPYKNRPYGLELLNPPADHRVDLSSPDGKHTLNLGSSSALIYGGARVNFCLVKNPEVWFQTEQADVYLEEGLGIKLPRDGYFMQGQNGQVDSQGVILGNENLAVQFNNGDAAVSHLQEGRSQPWTQYGWDNASRYPISSPDFVFQHLVERYKTRLEKDDNLWAVMGDFTAHDLRAHADYLAGQLNVIFLTGDLTFKADSTSGDVVYFVDGDVKIEHVVNKVNAAIIFTGEFKTLPNDPAVNDTTLEIKGVVAGLPSTPSKPNSPRIVLRRKHEFNDQPGERFIYDPQYLIKFRDLLGIAPISWQEIRTP